MHEAAFAGALTWWPTTQDASSRLSARELAIVLWNGNPQQAGMAEDWKKRWLRWGEVGLVIPRQPGVWVVKDGRPVLLQRHQIL